MAEIQVTHLKNLATKTRGLLGYKKATSVLLKTRFGIHTFGMHFPIDVLILNQKNEVVKMSHNLQPNKLFFWPILYDTVIELAAGEIKKKRIKIGERIVVKTK